MPSYHRTVKNLHGFLSSFDAGQTTTESELQLAVGWADSSLRTAFSKGTIAPYVERLANGRLRILQDGGQITLDAIKAAITQNKPKELILTPGLRIRGQNRQYVLEERLGAGAVGQVWSVNEVGGTSNPEYALKIMIPRKDLLDAGQLENIRKRFQKEGRNGQKLRCEGVIRVLDLGAYREAPFVVMPLASESLRKKISAGRMEVDAAFKVIKQCCEGLVSLHEQRHIHRDIKPDNILLYEDRYILGDLGIVRWSDYKPEFTRGNTITHASIQLGSWNYMAPEQHDDPHDVTTACDIYGLGITWIEMLSQRIPNPASIGAKKLPLIVDASGTKEIILSMVEVEPENRPTAKEILGFVENK